MGTTAGSGVWGLSGNEDGAEGEFDPVDGHSAVCAGYTSDTAWEVVGSDALGGPLSACAGA